MADEAKAFCIRHGVGYSGSNCTYCSENELIMIWNEKTDVSNQPPARKMWSRTVRTRIYRKRRSGVSRNSEPEPINVASSGN